MKYSVEGDGSKEKDPGDPAGLNRRVFGKSWRRSVSHMILHEENMQYALLTGVVVVSSLISLTKSVLLVLLESEDVDDFAETDREEQTVDTRCA